MILTLIHYIFAIIALALVVRLYITDYKQRKADDKEAAELEESKQTQIFDILVFIVLTLLF